MIFTRSMPGRMLVDGCQIQMQGREAHGPLRVLSFVSISNFTKTFNNNSAHIVQSACAMTGEYFSLVNILVYLIKTSQDEIHLDFNQEADAHEIFDPHSGGKQTLKYYRLVGCMNRIID